MTRRGTTFATLSVALLTLLGLTAGPSTAWGAGLSFDLSNTGSNGVEINIGITADGTVYVGGWDHIAKSSNNGASWTALDAGVTGPTAVAADRVLVVDRSTGRVFVDDTTLVCTRLSWSDDGGATWLSNYAACGGGVTDHQKIAIGKRTTLADPTGLLYPNIVYVCANGLTHTDCGASIDGGLAFLPSGPHGIGCAFQGAPIADAAGTLYEPSSCDNLHVWKTADNGLTWTNSVVLVNDQPVSSSSDTPNAAVTPDGTLYVGYTDAAWQPSFVRSPDGGATWDGPFLAGPPLSSAALPVIAAGADGHIAMSYYGTTDDASGWDHNPGNTPDDIRWNAYTSVVLDATSAVPSPEVAQLNPSSDPMQIGCMTKLGSCLSNIADYMGIEVAPNGHVWPVFVDGCPPGCTTHADSTQQTVVAGVQTGGPTL